MKDKGEAIRPFLFTIISIELWKIIYLKYAPTP